ncbi:hypothetical protein GCM10027416_29040 [Okibacterium endophyticum]
MNHVPLRRLSIGVSAIAVAVMLSACSGGGSTGASTRSADSAELQELTTKAQELVDAASAAQTVSPPAEGPRAVEGKKIMVIPCSMAAEGCARPANATVAAAEAIGWEATINDPGGDPSKMANAVSQAISSGYNGIVLTAIDAATIQGSLQQAKDAGLLIADFAATDVEDGGEPILDTNVPSIDDFYNAGYTMGAQMFLDHGPDMKILMLTGTEFGSIRARLEGTKAFVADCVAAGGSCEIVQEQNFLVTDLTTSLPSQAAGLVRSHPDADALWIGYDAGANFAVEGLESAGITDMPVYSFDANVANLTRIANGQTQVASVGSAMEWVGYGIVDNFNRIWAGEEVVDQGLTFKLLTKENVTSGEAWDGDVDVKPRYLEIWGR